MSRRTGSLLTFLILFAAIGIGQSGLSAQPQSAEILDEASARSLAGTLMPLIADDVIDGERRIMRLLPAGGYVGLFYRFRLRPEPVRYRSWCRMRSFLLYYDFVTRIGGQPGPVGSYDPLEMKRAGTLRSGHFISQDRFLQLLPEPRSANEHSARCRDADRTQGWSRPTDENSFSSQLGHLRLLRAALAERGRHIRFRCLRDGSPGCPISANLLLGILEEEPREFEMLTGADGRSRVQYRFYDPEPIARERQIRSLIVDEQRGTITEITLVYQTAPLVVI